MDLKTLQEEVNTRWEKQLDNPCHRSADQGHMILHMTKALGKIASALNDAEHENRFLMAHEIDKYIADLIICAARFTSRPPGVGLGDPIVDLDAACTKRLAEKFPVVT